MSFLAEVKHKEEYIKVGIFGEAFLLFQTDEE